MDLFLNNVHQCNIVKTLNTHHLQYVISSKKSENLEKSLCTKDEVGRYACDGRVFRQHCIKNRRYHCMDSSRNHCEQFTVPSTNAVISSSMQMTMKV